MYTLPNNSPKHCSTVPGVTGFGFYKGHVSIVTYYTPGTFTGTETHSLCPYKENTHTHTHIDIYIHIHAGFYYICELNF